MTQRLRIKLTYGALVASLAITAATLTALFALHGGVQAAREEKTLRVRSLEIVDAAGVARMRLGAPVPDPSNDGKTSPRRSPQSGVQLNDAKGNEIGGFGMLDDGSLILCFDSRTAEAACMYVLPSGERGFSVTDDHGTDRAKLTLNPDKSISLSLNDDHEKPRAEIRLNSGGSPEVRLTNKEGNLVWAAPQSH